ncbi:MAG: AAA family ATPase [Verrucomicrobia bacterium]|nr:AAA family ATPase [Verrucomicrobiota bacterium]
MLKTLRIRNLKCFRKLELRPLKRVNLIAGKNNTGKTALLEALLLLLDGPTYVAQLPSIFRNCGNLGDALENYWKWIFKDREAKQPVILQGDTDDYANYSVAISSQTPPREYNTWVRFSGDLQLSVLPQSLGPHAGINPQPPSRLSVVAIPVRQSDPQKDAVDYDRVVLKAGGEEKLETLLRHLEPRLKSIRSIKPYGASLIYVDIGLREKIPAVHLGQGFLRLVSIYSEIIASNKQVLLIDEIENGLHHSILADIWRGILNLAEQENVQVFATTHSYECIRAAHQAFAETLTYDFALHRLDEVRGEITVTTLDKDALETSLASNFEVR